MGRQGGKQYLNLGKYEPGEKCFKIGTIMHEFLHGEQFHRDIFVAINL